MIDLNDVDAGEYQLVAELWDEQTSKPGEPFTYTRHRRGDIVQLSQADARRLYGAGAVTRPPRPAPDPPAAVDPAGPDAQRPAQVASKPAWVAWAVAHGADPADADAMTKQDLIDKYGGA